MWVMIVVSHVYFGVSIEMHDFNTKEKCEAAAAMLVDLAGVESADCVEK